ncbi:MAG: hypothetical protein IIV87_03710 [Oscillospiraceae bacterium]|nr:hypothetical protein [Oscillospiraceae bacterium]
MLPAALVILWTLALDVEYLRMTLLWISAYFNYIFPVCMTALAAWYQRRIAAGEEKKRVLIAGAGFAVLAGASTEQCGIMSLVVTWGYALLITFVDKNHAKKNWLIPILTLAGFMTILLAPGSWARVGRGVEGGILSCLHPTVFLSRFYDAMVYVIKYPTAVELLACTDILAAALAFRDKRLPRALLAGLPLAILQVTAYLLKMAWPACILAAVSLVYLAVCFLFRKEYRMTGLMLLSSLAAQMTLIITTLGSERTAVAGIVALIIVCVSLLVKVLRYVPKRFAPLAVCLFAAACVLMYLPTLEGYTESKKVVDANLDAVERSKTTKVCEMNIDMDPRYRFTMLFEGSYFYDNFRKYYDMEDDVKIVFTSEKWDTASISDGKNVYTFPTLEDETGLYFPVEYAVFLAGGRAEWSWKNHTYLISFGERTYAVTEEGEVWRYLADGGKEFLGENMRILLPFSETYTLLYCPAAALTEYFGVEWSYDAAENVYLVRPNTQEG